MTHRSDIVWTARETEIRRRWMLRPEGQRAAADIHRFHAYLEDHNTKLLDGLRGAGDNFQRLQRLLKDLTSAQ